MLPIDTSLAMRRAVAAAGGAQAPPDAPIVAGGASCRHQIGDGSGREALHVARVLARSVAAHAGQA
jgi:hypothetical protein